MPRQVLFAVSHPVTKLHTALGQGSTVAHIVARSARARGDPSSRWTISWCAILYSGPLNAVDHLMVHHYIQWTI